MQSIRHDIREVAEPKFIGDSREQARIQTFIGDFVHRFGSEPDFVIKSPGRINLIGEHVDYHGFSVLPMAIENSILIGVSFDSQQHAANGLGLIRAVNKASDSYKSFEGKHSFAYGSQLDKSHDWHHYVLCGYHGVLANQLLQVKPGLVFKHAQELAGDRFDEDRVLEKQEATKHNLNLFIDSDLPPASGLSSSSALVCASAVATHLFLSTQKSALTNGHHGATPLRIDSNSMAENCAKFEHLIGTHGGGMDQAVIMTAQEGYAKHVEFMPEFRCTNVHLPGRVVWLVSHCGSSYQKAATCEFNKRVLETKLGAAIILKRLAGLSSNDSKLGHSLTLGQVKSEVFASMSTGDICKVMREQVFQGAEELGIDEICSRLEMSRQELLGRFKTSDEFLVKNGLDKRIKLLKRCLHVFQEAGRVEEFKQICDTTKDIRRLGRLMSESHASLRDQFECSHPDLDRLVEVSLGAGALGARLTGAGWGGCIVSLAEVERSETVLAALAKVSKFTFQTEPRSGCTIIRVRR